MKAYLDINQCKKLAEILPLDSADMVLLHEEPYETSDSKFDGLHQALCVSFSQYDKSWRQKYRNISYFPCWSLAALRTCLPPGISIDGILYVFESHNTFDNEWVYEYKFKDISAPLYSKSSNEIDAAVEMIIQLYEKY